MPLATCAYCNVLLISLRSMALMHFPVNYHCPIYSVLGIPRCNSELLKINALSIQLADLTDALSALEAP